ncbi:DNA-directed RNA polymerase III subunit C1 (rpo31) [Basidiobolus ranarum]|uniref:DNA-directed RNA polymerase subunit n=2 Tax=Basidiobolus ranarum TaxID=34480 RepID=A0ABR2X3W7_9FUNG
MKEHVVESAPKRIKHIQFGVLSPQQMMKLAEFEVTQRDLYNIPDRTPVKHGVLDMRLGTSDKSALCDTCGLKMADCVGHYGYVKLCLPVFHIGYFRSIITILQNICKTCSRVLLDENDRRIYLKRFRAPRLENLQRRNIVKAVNDKCKKVVYCTYCGATNGVVKKVGPLKITHEKFRAKRTASEQESFKQTFENAIAFAPELKSHVGKAQEDMNPLRVMQLFEKIIAEDCELLGLDPEEGRPESYIWRALPVPPVCIRPSVAQDGASTEDDLTVKLTEIIFTNALIKAGLEKGGSIMNLMEQWEFLQLSVGMYINSDIPGLANNMGGKPIRGFCQRLKGKQGRFRGNLSGKRVDFSSRTVISPDPNLRIDQVAVPEYVAKVLTFPERVFEHNIERLRKNVLNGPDIHPGANFIVQGNGFKKFLKYAKREQIASDLRIGDVVERHLSDGDVALFNRQPSLHKLSIMAHYVTVKPWRTFRFNECVCSPYNADFDGDEMNLHVPQTEEARMEAIELMGVKNNLVTPRNGEPLIAATQDFITASYLLSSKERFYNRSQFVQICSYMQDANIHIDIPPPAILKPVMLWTGKQVFNVLMRPNKQSQVLVNLETKCRSFEKKEGRAPDLCPNDGYLVIQNSELLCGVMDKSIVGDGNKFSLFYVVLRDYGADEAAIRMNRLAKLCARWLADQGFSIGISDVQPGYVLRTKKDALVEVAYKQCDELISKSKNGELENQPGCDEDQTLESHISGVLSKIRDDAGQICLTELNKYNAPLIMSICGSKGSKINVCQMVACVGQQIISGSRIPDGFVDRSLPHFLINSKTPPAKGFVRNSFYSGLTPTEFFFHAVSGREGLVDTAVKTAETGYMQRRLMKALEDLTTHYDLSVRSSSGGVVQFCYGDDGLDPATLEGDGQPVEFNRNLMHVRGVTPVGKDRPLLPYQITKIAREELKKPAFTKVCNSAFLESVETFIREYIVEKLAEVRRKNGMKEALDEPKSSKADIDKNIDPSIRKMINNKLTVTEPQLKAFLDVCLLKYMKAKIEPGSAVGALGAQSIGEPGTQMTLKTFHFAGVASMNVTLGVPRIKEIINAAKVISTPIITSKLVCDDSIQSARIIKGRIEKTLLGDIAEFIEEVYRPEECYIGIKFDLEAIQKLQLETDLYQIANAIVAAPKLKISASNVQVHKPDRVRVYVPQKDTSTLYYNLQALKRALPQVIIKGIHSVNRAVISEVTGSKVQLLVEGYGLREVMTTEGIVGTETTSNHVMEIQKVLGIEAARNTICHEIQYTMSKHGMTIDPRHVMLLGDIMTYKGEVLGITRFGIAKMKDSVLMLASFEKTTDHLFDAAMYAKRDSIEGVSECIIMGIPMPIGTGLFKLIHKSEQEALPKPRTLLFDNPEFHVC